MIQSVAEVLNADRHEDTEELEDRPETVVGSRPADG